MKTIDPKDVILPPPGQNDVILTDLNIVVFGAPTGNQAPSNIQLIKFGAIVFIFSTLDSVLGPSPVDSRLFNFCQIKNIKKYKNTFDEKYHDEICS